ncbi:hypothetical protein FOC4_g10004791 [Fusarium odoratissimum]|uniref:Uncharacterized protein n=1 Tax=Fusarium oxysporum f. sp. cubense (strain race 4) TaxID=2502994 RepID=N1S9F4_FUSC4|nr:hypothetical protein FOC4_g10004791 [Fusarium odoratissimum]
MASLDPIATAFIDYKYDEAVGFEGIDGIPCLACVATIDHDVRCRCLVNESGDTSCLLCDRNETVCDLVSLLRLPMCICSLTSILTWILCAK